MSPCDWNKGKGCTHHNLIERNHWGWAKIGDTFYRRISTEASTLDDKGGLIHWSANNVARGLGLSRALRDRAVVAAQVRHRPFTVRRRHPITDITSTCHSQ